MTGVRSFCRSRVGEQVDKWQLLALVGEGGMSQVYEARHAVVGRRAAVKFLNTQLARMPDRYARFLQEAKIAGTLESKHIVQVWDSGVAPDETPYLVMEFLDGQNLASILAEQGRFESARAVDLILQACRGLRAAHGNNIIHRDLKPGNLFVCPQEDGTSLLKVLDFGIAKLEAPEAQGSKTPSESIIGTPHYMSPEHAKGTKNVDKRTDIYALGVILYEALSGSRPHDGDSFNAILYHIVSTEPQPLELLRSELPQGLVQVVQRAMARDPSRRFQSVEELALALAPFRARNDASWTPEVVLRTALTPGSSDAPTPAEDFVEFGVRSPQDGFDVIRPPLPSLGSRNVPSRMRWYLVSGTVAWLGVVALYLQWATSESPLAATSQAVPKQAASARTTPGSLAGSLATTGPAERGPSGTLLPPSPEASAAGLSAAGRYDGRAGRDTLLSATTAGTGSREPRRFGRAATLHSNQGREGGRETSTSLRPGSPRAPVSLPGMVDAGSPDVPATPNKLGPLPHFERTF